MTNIELNAKISRSLLELKSDIENFVKENAKFKVGDVVIGGISSNNNYFVINEVGFDFTNHRENKIVYYATRLIKSTGEISFMDLDSNIGTPENMLKKATLIIKNKEISFFEDHRYFKRDLKIKFQ